MLCLSRMSEGPYVVTLRYRLRARLAHAVPIAHERGPYVVTLRYRLRARLAHAPESSASSSATAVRRCPANACIRSATAAGVAR